MACSSCATRTGMRSTRATTGSSNGATARKRTLDATRHCYGLAFVLLAYSHAAMAGIEEAKPMIGATFELMEHRFWDAAAGLYADEATPDWRVSSYRGQNANMHTTEALLAAHEATGHLVYLDRAERVASNITLRQAKLSQGLVWEHFHADWSVDWHYNEEDSSNIFRPWGFQPGHQTEWAKLLLILERYRPLPWLLPRAIELFDAAMTHAWDEDHGGLYYGFGPDGTVCDHDKYFWVQAETFATAALLGKRTGNERFWDWYDEIWRYSWAHFVDHKYGAWYRILTCDNRKYSDEKSPPARPTITRWARATKCWRTHCLPARPLRPNPRSKRNEPPDANTEFPLFVSAGDILTDLVRTGASQWLSRARRRRLERRALRGAARFADRVRRLAGRRQFLRRSVEREHRRGARHALHAARGASAVARDRSSDASACVFLHGRERRRSRVRSGTLAGRLDRRR